MSDTYSQGGAVPSFTYGYADRSITAPQSSSSEVSPGQTLLRRRQVEHAGGYGVPFNGDGTSHGRFGNEHGAAGSKYSANSSSPRKAVVKKLDFMFPKVDAEYTVRTDYGGVSSLIAYILIAVLSLSEIWSHASMNGSTNEHVVMDSSLGKRMQVNLNITFPGLACEDLHVDIMDIAGDSQVGIEDTMKKRRLNRRGLPMGEDEIVESNKHRLDQDKRKNIQATKIPDNYCGPCFGAEETEGQCCNTCDELIAAYKKKRWRHDILVQSSEQCIREGKDKLEMKKLRKGEGCNVYGYFNINRVGGNFHIAMGEGIERDGRHIHTFNPDDTHNFNASHIIHHLSFGPEYDFDKREDKKVSEADRTTLNGVSKFVDKSYGTTGLFQYFIKIVPTTYISDDGNTVVETNKYYFTERFRPLMKEYLDDDAFFHDDDVDEENEENKQPLAAVKAGHSGSHAHQDHHNVKNAVLPGVFFIYEIYPFAVEVRKSYVPISHLFVRLMATVGGVFTLLKLVDTLLFTVKRDLKQQPFR